MSVDHAGHVGVHAEHSRRCLRGHQIRDNRAPVAALRDELVDPRRFISATQAVAIWSGPQPGASGLSEYP